jgi:hypothetical protein
VDPGRTVEPRLVELAKAGIGVGLQDADEVSEMRLRVLAIDGQEAIDPISEGDRARRPWRAVGREPIRCGRRVFAAPRAVIPDIDPDAAFLHAALLAGELHLRVEHADRRVVGVEAIGCHHLGADQVGDRADGTGSLAAPVDECRAGDVGAETGEDLALPVEREVIVELRDQDVCQETGPGQTARDRPGLQGLLALSLSGIGSKASWPLMAPGSAPCARSRGRTSSAGGPRSPSAWRR